MASIPTSESTNSTFDIVIIGAGIAGLETARLLSSNSGLRVAVVEARSRIGGRVWSQPLRAKIDSERGSGGDPFDCVKVDMGASWIHGSLLQAHSQATSCMSPLASMNSNREEAETLRINPLIAAAQRAGLRLVEYPFQSFTDSSFFRVNAEWWRAKGFWAYNHENSTLAPDIVAKNWARFCLLLNSALHQQRSRPAVSETIVSKLKPTQTLRARILQKIHHGRTSGMLTPDDEAMLLWFVSAFEDDSGATMDQVHPLDWDNPPSLLGNDYDLKEGMTDLINSLLPAAEEVLQDYRDRDEIGPHSASCGRFGSPAQTLYKLMLGEEVTSVKWRSNDEVEDDSVSKLWGEADSNVVAKIFTSSGKVISALNAVVITVPLGVLQSEDSIAFYPTLPDSYLEAIRAIGMGHSTKIILRFSSAFWPADARLLAVIRPAPSSDMGYENDKVYDKTPLHSVTFNMYWSLLETTGQPILVTACTGQDAIEVETWSEDRLRAAVLAPLEATFGTSTVNSVNLLGMLRSTWSSDRFSKGAYSFPKYNSRGESGLDAKAREMLLEPVGETLYFAGEATSEDYYGTAHGAMLSAKRVSHDIMLRWSVECVERIFDGKTLQAKSIVDVKQFGPREMLMLDVYDLDDASECKLILRSVETISRIRVLKSIRFHDLPPSMIFDDTAKQKHEMGPCEVELRSMVRLLVHRDMRVNLEDDDWDFIPTISISFEGTELSDIGAEYLSEALNPIPNDNNRDNSCAGQLISKWSWNFSGNNLHHEGARAIVKSWLHIMRRADPRQLPILDLSDNEIGHEAAADITRLLVEFGQSFSGSRIFNKVQAEAEATLPIGIAKDRTTSREKYPRSKRSPLICLLLHDNDIDEEGLSALAGAQTFLASRLTKFNFGRWCIALHGNDDDTIPIDSCAYECMEKLHQSTIGFPSSLNETTHSCDRHIAHSVADIIFESQDEFSNHILNESFG